MHFSRLFLIALLIPGLQAWSQKASLESINKSINSPNGGMKQVKQLIYLEMEYPLEDIKTETDGDVVIEYKLPVDGIPTDVKVSSSPSPTLAAEGMRLFKKICFSENSRRVNWSSQSEKMVFNFNRKNWVKVYTKRGYQEIMYIHEPIDSTETLYKYQTLETKPYPMYEKNENYRDYLHYISAKLEYPQEALKLGIKGQVIVSFVIEQSGNLTNIKVEQTLPAGCTEEALRLIKSLRWYPAVVDDTAVRTYMISSIGFGTSSSTYHEVFNQGTSGR
ncbi:TonB family protein [bacterium SCSIO 12741]|nr:TonB family protein [bacterium SCSIO 12741]